MRTVFRVENVSTSYGTKKVVKNVSFEIKEGEFCGLIGLNGSGKTTLLHSACGFLPMQGECFVGEQACSKLNERQRAQLISFIPQVCSLEGGKTSLDVVEMGFNPWLSLLSSPSSEQKAMARKALERLNSEHLAECDFGEISQGQRQMVVLARCIAQNTPVMLMDEPDSALDFLNKHVVLDKIRELIKEDKKAGLVTLHDPNFAMEYCDKLFLLKQGEVVAVVDMKQDNAEEIHQKLSLIYGDIELVPNGSGYLMGKGKR